MNDEALWASWQLWMGVAALVVVIAAALLIGILVTARRILAEAERALAAAEEIRRHTEPIWQLQDTNAVATRILASVQNIEAKGGALVAALEGENAHAK